MESSQSRAVRWWIIGLVMASLAFIGIGFLVSNRNGSRNPANEPAIIEVPASFDIGVVPSGSRYPARVSLKNKTDRPVTVMVTGSSCSCISASLEATQIPPHEAGTLLVTLEVSEKENAVGEVSLVAQCPHTVATATAHPLITQPAKIRIVGKVDRTAGLEPSKIDFGTIVRDAGVATRKVRIRRVEGTSPDLARLVKASLPDFLALQVVDISAVENELCDIEASLQIDTNKLPKDSGPFAIRVQMDVPTRLGTQPYLLVAAGTIRNHVESNPSGIFWSRSVPTTAQKLTLQTHDGNPAKIEAINSDIEGLIWTSSDKEWLAGETTVDCASVAASEKLIRGKIEVTVRRSQDAIDVVTVPVIINR